MIPSFHFIQLIDGCIILVNLIYLANSINNCRSSYFLLVFIKLIKMHIIIYAKEYIEFQNLQESSSLQNLLSIN